MLNEKNVAPTEIKNTSRLMTFTYVISLSVIACLSIAVHFMLDDVIAEQSKSAELINISGQQRMLSQRSSLFMMEHILTANQDSKLQALDALKKMNSNHQWLISEHQSSVDQGRESPLSEELQNLYFNDPFNIEKKINLYNQLLKTALSESELGSDTQRVNLDFLTLAKQPLLDAFNIAVEQYQKESDEKVDELRNAQTVILYIVILTILAEAIFIFRPMVRKVVVYATKLEYEAHHDGLTGLFNRRAFTKFSQKYTALAQRQDQNVSLVTFDIDFFKKINDTHGHDIGDKAICHVAKIIEQETRESDLAARIGGEEFVLLLANTQSEQAILVAEKIRHKVEKTPIKIDLIEINLTISAGVTTIKPTESNIEKAFKSADAALYVSKENGRNCVNFAA